MRAVTYIEIDVPEFAGTSSPIPTETYRFAKPANYLPRGIEAIPSVKSISYTPSRVSLGEDLGERASLDIVFKDHQHIFNGEDFDSGTFWGKWRARYVTRLIGNAVRWYQGFEGQALEDMTVRHFIIDKVEGPNLNGEYKITAKDILKHLDDDRAQAPKASSGFIASDLSDSATSATLSPVGIGDAEYPSSGYVAIGGEEICEFTRSGDTLTLTRSTSVPGYTYQTNVQAHDAGSRVQVCLSYIGEDPADIIADLLENYADMPASYIPISDWQTETGSFLQRVYTTLITEPTGVRKLLSELAEQAALAIWDDLTTPQVRLQVLRQISTDAERFTPDNILVDPQLTIKEQPKRRLSQVWTYFGQRNPLEPLDEAKNYRSVAVTADFEAEDDYGRPAIKKIYSRWVPFGGRVVAERVNDIQIARYKDPPRRFSFGVMRGGEIVPALGGGYRIENYPIQTETGLPTNAPIQVTRLNPGPAIIRVEADEALYQADPIDLTNRVIVIDADSFNIKLRELHDAIYPAPTGNESPAVTITFVIAENVTIGSTTTGDSAVDVDSGDQSEWPAGINLRLVVRGKIRGKGADAPNATLNGVDGNLGGNAIFTRTPIELILNEGSGQIWSGGGSGCAPSEVDGRGVGGPGGGAGIFAGSGGLAYNGTSHGEDGTATEGGRGGFDRRDGTRGGDPGQDGEDTSVSFGNSQGGNAGNAIDGISFVTKTGTGDVRGPEAN